MIAEVGDMLKVSGSRIATPLAPPRPGSTPMMHAEHDADHHDDDVLTGCSTTAKPCNQIANLFHRPSPSPLCSPV